MWFRDRNISDKCHAIDLNPWGFFIHISCVSNSGNENIIIPCDLSNHSVADIYLINRNKLCIFLTACVLNSCPINKINSCNFLTPSIWEWFPIKNPNLFEFWSPAVVDNCINPIRCATITTLYILDYYFQSFQIIEQLIQNKNRAIENVIIPTALQKLSLILKDGQAEYHLKPHIHTRQL